MHRSSSRDFLERLARQAHGRVADIPAGRTFCRAQVAHDDRYEEMIADTIPDAAPPSRMRPLPDQASEGRVNPKGIPCLYLAGDPHTAVAEVRPWIGSLVTLAYFKIRRPLRVVDCTKDMAQELIYLEEEPGPDARNRAVWGELGRALREPVLRDDVVAQYGATQVVAEVFRSEGFDGIAYRSAFGEDRFTLALFDLDAARLTSAVLHEVREIQFDFRESGNPYFVPDEGSGDPRPFRQVITEIRPVDSNLKRQRERAPGPKRKPSRMRDQGPKSS